MRHDLVRADCNLCMLAGPDRDGQYDLLEDDRCPYHGDDTVNPWLDRYERERAEKEDAAWELEMREQDRLAGHAPATPSPMDGRVDGTLSPPVPSPQGKDAPRPPAPSPPGGWAPPSFPEWAE